jgi:hypothetical protein
MDHSLKDAKPIHYTVVCLMGIKIRLDISKVIKLSSLRLSALGKIKHVALSTILVYPVLLYSLHFFFMNKKHTT